MIRILPLSLFLPSLLLCLALLPAAALHAVEVDVHSGQAAVADQGVEERNRAMPLALANALEKHSGMRGLETLPGVPEAIANAPSLLVSYHYEMAELPRGDGSVQEELRLRASFSGARVNELARDLALPLWRADRDALEVWVVVDTGMQREVLPLELAYLQQRLADVAGRRGQPLVWPQPDEDGMYAVSTQLLWGGYTEDLANPRGTGVLILAAQRRGAEWSVRANLGFAGEHTSLRLEGFDLDGIMEEALHQAIDRIAASRAIGAEGLSRSEFELTVEGVNSAREFQELLAYLQGLSIVNRVDVLAARPTGLTFLLRLDALPDYLLDVFDQDGVIVEAEKTGNYRMAAEESFR